ncbi:MAG: hypothetical protein H7238_02965, partial [Polaromonas sp.]|nr:hypothetical protein [Polaromonas sp.]
MRPATFFAGLFLLAMAPFFRGGNRYVPLIGLEWLALGVLWLMATGHLLGRDTPPQAPNAASLAWGEWVLLLSPLWAALTFLVPVPMVLWAASPGHSLHLNAPDASWRPLSLMPDATAASLMAGIPVVAAFALSRTAPLNLFGLL